MSMWQRYNKYFIAITLLSSTILLLSGCFFESSDGPPHFYVDASKVPNAVPKPLQKSAYGNPPVYTVNGETYHVLNTSKNYHATGVASWYGTKFHEQRTSSGEPYDMLKMTAAHTTLPIPTFVKVTNLENGRQIIVKVNDRGPFEKNRLIDLSYVAAEKLGILSKGTGFVRVDAIDPNTFEKPILAQHNLKPINKESAQIYLQVGAYQDYANAQYMQKYAQSIAHINCHINRDSLNGEPLYRVKIGPIANQNIAGRITERLENAGLKKPSAIIQ